MQLRGQEQRIVTSEKGTANANHTHTHTAALSNKCLGHKYITTVS